MLMRLDPVRSKDQERDAEHEAEEHADALSDNTHIHITDPISDSELDKMQDALHVRSTRGTWSDARSSARRRLRHATHAYEKERNKDHES